MAVDDQRTATVPRRVPVYMATGPKRLSAASLFLWRSLSLPRPITNRRTLRSEKACLSVSASTPVDDVVSVGRSRSALHGASFSDTVIFRKEVTALSARL